MGEKQKASNEHRAPEIVKVIGINLAFSQKGLNIVINPVVKIAWEISSVANLK